jgi:hypothetical protein
LNTFNYERNAAMTPLVATYANLPRPERHLTVWGRPHAAQERPVFSWSTHFRGKAELADSVNHLLVVGLLPDQPGVHQPGAEARYQVVDAADAMGSALAQRSAWCCSCWA